MRLEDRRGMRRRFEARKQETTSSVQQGDLSDGIRAMTYKIDNNGTI